MEKGYDITEILQYLNPAELNYQEWISVGMALKEEGYNASVWDQWSKADSRYHAGECERKWNGFHGNAAPVTAGTVVQIAKEHGWKPPEIEGHELEWDAYIGDREERVIVDRSWLEGQDVEEPSLWSPAAQLIRYLETLFESGESVGYVTESWEKTDEKGTRWLPKKGYWKRKAGELIEALNQCKDDLGAVLGDYRKEAGAWIRFNPLDGKDCKNENVTDFRYALVESDAMPIEQQNAIIRELELPVACLVHSGKKSLHAIVRVEAASYEEYRKRVDYLYHICQKNGMKVDTQNKNPSRLSRMPGVVRDGHKQFLVDTNIGKSSWNEWFEWIEGLNDDLPEPESLAQVWENLPELSPPLIDGVLRQGHKLLLAGPSKAGKSFSLIELSIAIAEGRKWVDWHCTQGKVLYVNLELDRASCLHRFKDVYQALGWQPDHLGNIHIWNLRGKSVPMDKLAPRLIRRASKKGYIAVIIDPIYKVITGDENSADQMAHFCNQFDKVCTELGTAVIYCHHHSKGSQGGKRSIDRASGSGVFARDPDAILDLIELEIPEPLLEQEKNKVVCNACIQYLNEHCEWEDDVSQDTMCSSSQMLAYCEKRLTKAEMGTLKSLVEKAGIKARQKTAWRIEGTLREFPKFEPVNLWFDYPAHRLDQVGVLSDIEPDTDRPAWQKRKKTPQERKKERDVSLKMAFEANDLEGTGKIKISDLGEYMGVTLNTVKKYVDESKEFRRENGMVSKCQKPKSDS